MTPACAKCLSRKAARLRAAAARVAEADLAAAAVRLEIHHTRHPCPRLSGAIALHYLLLADHPDVAEQPLAVDRYRQQAAAWLRRAHLPREAHGRAAVPQPAHLDS